MSLIWISRTIGINAEEYCLISVLFRMLTLLEVRIFERAGAFSVDIHKSIVENTRL
jgi:hypothetical protein